MESQMYNVSSPLVPCGANNSLCGGSGEETVYDMAATFLRQFGQPCVVLFGLLGNTMSMCVFLTRRMRTATCSVFLAALAFVDNGFLLSLFSSWFDSVVYNIFSTDIVCKVFVFVTYMFSFLSVWFIVGFTCERFFAICFPLQFKEMREKHFVIGMSLFAAVLYSFSFCTVEVQNIAGYYRCVPKFHLFEFLNVITWVDTFLTVVVPFLLIVVMNTMVTRAALTAFPTKTVTRIEMQPLESNTSPVDNNNGDTHKPVNSSFSAHGRRRSTSRITRTMLLVSTTFLVLNLPSHAIRLHSLISSVASSNTYTPMPPHMALLRELAQFLYYSTFACNFLLYTMFGRNFKRTLVDLMRCQRTSRWRFKPGSSLTSSRTTNRETA